MTRRKSRTLETRAKVLDYLNDVGNMAAAEAAVAVCKDPKATAQAKATASSAIFKATGLGGHSRTFTPPEAVDEGNPYEGLTLDELQSILAYLEAKATDPNTPEPRIAAFSNIDDDETEDEGSNPFD